MLKSFQNSVQNHLIEPALKPIQLDRKIVMFRKKLNRLMNTTNRFQNVTLSNNVKTRIEKYENKQVVLVFANIDSVCLKPYKKVFH